MSPVDSSLRSECALAPGLRSVATATLLVASWGALGGSALASPADGPWDLRDVSPGPPPSSSNALLPPTVSNFGSLQTLVDGEPFPWPLRHTEVEIRVQGRVASVRVTQRFTNPYPEPIEAVYLFPLPADAAVHAYELQVGARGLRGEVKRRAEARRVYERARDEGRTAGLLDQEWPNVFTQQVANILPGEGVTVVLQYVELLPFRQGAYELVFPLVVGPRYVSGAHAPTPVERSTPGRAPLPGASVPVGSVPDPVTAPSLAPGERPGHDVSLRVHIDAGSTLQELLNPTHRVRVRAGDEGHAWVELAGEDRLPNRDFVLRYSVAGRQPSCSVLTHEDERGGFFLLLVQPQAEVAADAGAPREIVFVVDASGSMNGWPLQRAQAVLQQALQELGQHDRFQVIRFAATAEALFPVAVQATELRVRHAAEWITGWHSGGGTEFVPALDLALNAAPDPRRSRVVLLLTDGFIGYEDSVLRYVRDHGAGTSLFPLGVGSSVNRFLIDALARAGQAEPLYLLRGDDPVPVVRRFYDTVAKPALTDIDLAFVGSRVHSLTPATLPDLFVERPLYVLGRYDGAAPALASLRGRLAGRPWAQRCVTQPEPSSAPGERPALPLLWARLRIRELMDEWRAAHEGRAELQREITQLGLSFGLATRFTSFVAVDPQTRTASGRPARVPIPLALPEGIRVPPHAGPSGPRLRRLTSFEPGTGGRASAPPLRSRLVAPGSSPLQGSRTRTQGSSSRMQGSRMPTPGNDSPSQRLAARSRSRATAEPPRSERRVRAAVSAAGSAEAGSYEDSGRAMARALRRNLRSVRRLYERALRRSSTLRGRLELVLEIGADGRVLRASLGEGSIADRELRAGLIELARRWRFPRPPGGRPVTIRYPFVFASG